MKKLKEFSNILNRLNGYTFYFTIAFISLVIFTTQAFLIVLKTGNIIEILNPYTLVMFINMLVFGIPAFYYFYVENDKLISFKLEVKKVAKKIFIFDKPIVKGVAEKDTLLTEEEIERLEEVLAAEEKGGK